MNQLPDDGGPAFPVPMFTRQADGQPMSAGEFFEGGNGATLRDWFAATIRLSQRDLEQFSGCDDQDLLQRYGTKEEIEDGFRYVSPGSPMPVMNIILRQRLEARGRAELRYIEADAMLAARKGGTP